MQPVGAEQFPTVSSSARSHSNSCDPLFRLDFQSFSIRLLLKDLSFFTGAIQQQGNLNTYIFDQGFVTCYTLKG